MFFSFSSWFFHKAPLNCVKKPTVFKVCGLNNIEAGVCTTVSSRTVTTSARGIDFQPRFYGWWTKNSEVCAARLSFRNRTTSNWKTVFLGEFKCMKKFERAISDDWRFTNNFIFSTTALSWGYPKLFSKATSLIFCRLLFLFQSFRSHQLFRFGWQCG